MSQVTPDHILQVGTGFWASKTLLSAVEMELFTELAKHPETLAELSARLGLHPRSAHDFLDALVALNFLERRDGTYYNTPSTDLFLDKRKPSYIGGILEMANHRLYPFWGHLTTALRTGEPQNEARNGGDNPFVALYADPDRLRGFLNAMTGISHGANMAIAKKFPWANYKSAVDVGTAQGDLITQVALANPHLAGTGFDLPEVGPIFEDYIAEQRPLRPRQLPPRQLLRRPHPQGRRRHDGPHPPRLGPRTKKMLIRKAYEAIPSGGAFIVYESIIDDDRSKNAFGLLMSLNMLIETPGGFDYTGADCMGWMKEAGFHSTRVEHLVGPDSMVIGIK